MQKIRESTQSLLFGRDALAPPEIPAEIAAISEWDEMLKWSYEKKPWASTSAAIPFPITGASSPV